MEKNKNVNLIAKLGWSGVINFHCMLMTLSSACDIFLTMIEMTCDVNHFLTSANDVISLESKPFNLCVFIHAYSLQPQTYS